MEKRLNQSSYVSVHSAVSRPPLSLADFSCSSEDKVAASGSGSRLTWWSFSADRKLPSL